MLEQALQEEALYVEGKDVRGEQVAIGNSRELSLLSSFM